MGVSKHRPKHKQKLAARKKREVARKRQIQGLVKELETEFAKVESLNSNPTISTVATPGVFLTPTPDEQEILQHYDNLEI